MTILCRDRWTLFTCGWSTLIGFACGSGMSRLSVGIEIKLVFVCVVEINLISAKGIENDTILCGGLNWLDLIIGVGMTWFSCACRN